MLECWGVGGSECLGSLLTSLVLLPSMRLEDDIRVNLARDKEGGGHVGPAATRLL